MNPNAPAKPRLESLADSLMTYALKNRFIKDDGVAHKLAYDFLPTVEIYIKERLTYEMFYSKLENHKLNIRLGETLAENAVLKGKTILSREIVERLLGFHEAFCTHVQEAIRSQDEPIRQARSDLADVGY